MWAFSFYFPLKTLWLLLKVLSKSKYFLVYCNYYCLAICLLLCKTCQNCWEFLIKWDLGVEKVSLNGLSWILQSQQALKDLKSSWTLEVSQGNMTALQEMQTKSILGIWNWAAFVISCGAVQAFLRFLPFLSYLIFPTVYLTFTFI